MRPLRVFRPHTVATFLANRTAAIAQTTKVQQKHTKADVNLRSIYRISYSHAGTSELLPRSFSISFSTNGAPGGQKDPAFVLGAGWDGGGENVAVAVWWDIENCHVPQGIEAYKVGVNIFTGLRMCGFKGPVSISAYGDTLHLSRNTQEALASTGIRLHHIPSGGKDSSDRALLVDLILWALEHPPPAHLFLISGDRDFSNALHRLRMMNYNILLACPAGNTISPALTGAATHVWQWNGLVRGEGLLLANLPNNPHLGGRPPENFATGGPAVRQGVQSFFSSPSFSGSKGLDVRVPEDAGGKSNLSAVSPPLPSRPAASPPVESCSRIMKGDPSSSNSANRLVSISLPQSAFLQESKPCAEKKSPADEAKSSIQANSADTSRRQIPAKVLKQLKSLVDSHPDGILLSDLQKHLASEKIVFDKDFYGHGRLLAFLSSIPNVLHVDRVLHKDGKSWVHRLTSRRGAAEIQRRSCDLRDSEKSEKPFANVTVPEMMQQTAPSKSDTPTVLETSGESTSQAEVLPALALSTQVEGRVDSANVARVHPISNEQNDNVAPPVDHQTPTQSATDLSGVSASTSLPTGARKLDQGDQVSKNTHLSSWGLRSFLSFLVAKFRSWQGDTVDGQVKSQGQLRAVSDMASKKYGEGSSAVAQESDANCSKQPEMDGTGTQANLRYSRPGRTNSKLWRTAGSTESSEPPAVYDFSDLDEITSKDVLSPQRRSDTKRVSVNVEDAGATSSQEPNYPRACEPSILHDQSGSMKEKDNNDLKKLSFLEDQDSDRMQTMVCFQDDFEGRLLGGPEANSHQSVVDVKYSSLVLDTKDIGGTSSSFAGGLDSSTHALSSANPLAPNLREFQDWCLENIKESYKNSERTRTTGFDLSLLKPGFEKEFGVRLDPRAYGFLKLQDLVASITLIKVARHESRVFCLLEGSEKFEDLESTAGNSGDLSTHKLWPKMYHDCKSLVQELLLENPEGIPGMRLKPLFMSRFHYPLDHKCAGYPRMSDLLRLMTDVVSVNGKLLVPSDEFRLIMQSKTNTEQTRSRRDSTGENDIHDTLCRNVQEANPGKPASGSPRIRVEIDSEGVGNTSEEQVELGLEATPFAIQSEQLRFGAGASNGEFFNQQEYMKSMYPGQTERLLRTAPQGPTSPSSSNSSPQAMMDLVYKDDKNSTSEVRGEEPILGANLTSVSIGAADTETDLKHTDIPENENILGSRKSDVDAAPKNSGQSTTSSRSCDRTDSSDSEFNAVSISCEEESSDVSSLRNGSYDKPFEGLTNISCNMMGQSAIRGESLDPDAPALSESDTNPPRTSFSVSGEEGEEDRSSLKTFSVTAQDGLLTIGMTQQADASVREYKFPAAGKDQELEQGKKAHLRSRSHRQEESHGCPEANGFSEMQNVSAEVLEGGRVGKVAASVLVNKMDAIDKSRTVGQLRHTPPHASPKNPIDIETAEVGHETTRTQSPARTSIWRRLLFFRD